jgi:hypothetical protein
MPRSRVAEACRTQVRIRREDLYQVHQTQRFAKIRTFVQDVLVKRQV